MLFTLLLAAFLVAGFAQKPYKVMFWNVENLFDTINDPEVRDDEFTPEGPKAWNDAKYRKKLGNIERVLFDVAAIDRIYPAVIGIDVFAVPAKIFYVFSEISAVGIIKSCHKLGVSRACGVLQINTQQGNHRIIQ